MYQYNKKKIDEGCTVWPNAHIETLPGTFRVFLGNVEDTSIVGHNLEKPRVQMLKMFFGLLATCSAI